MNTKQLSQLFEIGGDELPYLTKEARNIASFKEIIIRDKGKQKNVAGVNKFIKVVAIKEIAFIYFYVNSDLYANYDNNDKIAIIRKRLDIDFELDELVWKAIGEFEEDAITREDKMLDNYYEVLNGYNTLLRSITTKTLDSIRLLETPVGELTIAQVSERTSLIDSCRNDLKWALDTSNQLKTAFKNIDDLKIQKASKERKNKVNLLETDKKRYERKERVL